MPATLNGSLVGGGGGGAPSGPAGGDLGGTYPNPTVTDLTIASEARGDLLRRGASAWQRVSAKTSGNLVGGDGTDVVSLTPAVAAPPLAFANGHTQPDAATRFLWYFNEASGAIVNYGTEGTAANLTASGSTTQGSLLLASLNGRGLLCSGASGSSASGGTNTTPGVDNGLTWWAIFTVIAPPTARRATVLTRNANNPWASPYNSLAIVVDSATAIPARAIVTEIGKVSGGYTEHVASAAYTDGVQVSVVATMTGSTWTVYVNGVLDGTYGDGGAIDWGDGTGYWQIGGNASGEEANIHVTEAGCAAEVWTAAQVIEFEQRRLGRWHG